MSLCLGTEPLKEQGEVGGNVQTQTAFFSEERTNESHFICVWVGPKLVWTICNREKPLFRMEKWFLFRPKFVLIGASPLLLQLYKNLFNQ